MVDYSGLSNKEIKELLEQAKESYYNTGVEIIPDNVYDELEKKVGLENINYVGTKRNSSYVVKHPFMMGSLSKVQVHEKNGMVDWDTHFNSAYKYYKSSQVIVTPKFDGCSWELVMNMTGDVISISSRGDGNFGKDLQKHLEDKFDNGFLNDIVKTTHKLYPKVSHIVLRGEVLAKKSVYETSYKDKFSNPRTMVSGILNHDFDESDNDFLKSLKFLDIVCYFVAVNYVDNEFKEVDWIKYVSEKTRHVFPTFYDDAIMIDSSKKFENIYNKFKNFRSNCDYPLDGIVIKPNQGYRTASVDEQRPSDSVAIKFVPQLKETTVTGIDWKVGKTGEMIPTVVFESVEMGGKMVTRASGHNYGYLTGNRISIGTKLIVSLAGDISPFIYKVSDSSVFDKCRLGLDNISGTTHVDGCHLMYDANEEDLKKNYLFNTLMTLNVDKLGEVNAKKVVDYLSASELPEHALMIDPIVFENAIGGKTGKAVSKSFKTMLSTISFAEIIESCNFRFCGNKVSKQVANKLLGLPFDYSSFASEGYSWADDEESKKYKLLIYILNFLGKSFESFKSAQVKSDVV
jgi:DNA ligase (NAD+)